MSGELDTRPDLVGQIRVLRDRLDELERRIAGDEQRYDLSDINDVRVDSLGDNTVTLADGNALTYRAADKIWVPGSGTTGFPVTFNDGTYTYEVTAPTDNTDFGFSTHELALAVYAAGLAPESLLSMSALDGVHLQTNNGILIETSTGDITIVSAGDASLGGLGQTSISAGADILITAGGGNRITMQPIVEVTNYITGRKIADPAAPAANKGDLYVRDNGAGKMQWVAKFPTGAVQVIVTEP